MFRLSLYVRFIASMGCLAGFQCIAPAADLISINFESGNLGAPGSAGDGWKLWDAGAPGQNLATIGSTGRTFLTGTSGNDQALFIKPATAGVANNDLVGAEFKTNTPISISATDRIYLVTESFSDMSAFSDQYMKLDVKWGFAGNGGAYGGFDGTPTSGGATFGVNDNYNTEPTDANQQARMSLLGTSGVAVGGDVKYVGSDVAFGGPDNNPGVPANNFLDRTYVQKSIFRPNGDGSEVNVEMQGTGYNGSTIVRSNSVEGRETENSATPVKIFNGYSSLTIDRVSVHMRRHVGLYDGPGGNADTVTNGFAGATGYSSNAVLVGNPATDPTTYSVSNSPSLKFGIKSIRIGVADATDFNLDGVTNAADFAIVQANQGIASEATFFEGDVDNDGDVDGEDLAAFVVPGDFNADLDVDGNDFLVWQRGFGGGYDAGDLADWQTNFGSGSAGDATVGSVPEPSGLTLLILGLFGASVRGRLRTSTLLIQTSGENRAW